MNTREEQEKDSLVQCVGCIDKVNYNRVLRSLL